MAFNITYLFEAIDKYTRPARTILQSTKRLERGFQRLNKVAEFGAALQRKNMFIMAGTNLAIVGMGVGILHTTGTFQKLNMSFHAMMDNQQDATDLFQKMIQMSQKFGAATTVELAGAARSLLAVGGHAKNIPTVLNRLLDISSLTGVSLENLTTSYKQVFATGVVRRQYTKMILKSTTLLQGMADILHKTKGETFNLIREGKVGFAVFAKAIKNATSVGGQYFEGQKKGAHTIFGAFNAVKDAVQVLMNVTGEFLNQQFKIVDRMLKLRAAVRSLNKNFGFYGKKYGHLVKVILEGLVAFAALVTFNFLLGTVLRSVGIIMVLYRATVVTVTAALWLWRSGLLAVIAAQLIAAAPFLAFAAILGGVVYALIRVLKYFHLWKGTLYTLGKAVTDYIVDPLDHMIDRLEVAIKTLEKFISLSPSIKTIEAPFKYLARSGAAAGAWIGGHLPVPTHLFDAQMAQRFTTRAMLPSIYNIGVPEGAKLTVAQGGFSLPPLLAKFTAAQGGFSPPPLLAAAQPGFGGATFATAATTNIVAAFQEAFPNLNEGLKTHVQVNIDGKGVGSADHVGHAAGYVDVGLNMPFAAGGSA